MKSLISLLLLVFCTSVLAQSLTDELRSCAEIESDAERLNCYDALSANADRIPETNPVQERVPEPEVEEEETDTQFATITEIRMSSTDRHIITLDNGQIWRQIDTHHVSWEPGQEIRIERGMFNSRFMRPAEGGYRIRVTLAN